MRVPLTLSVLVSLLALSLTGCGPGEANSARQAELEQRVAELEQDRTAAEARAAELEASLASVQARLERITAEKERMQGSLYSLAEQVMPTLPVVEVSDLEALVAEAAEQGQVVVIDFWATWCAPCVAMFPDLHAGLKAMGDRVRPVTVTLDDPGSFEQQAIRFLAEHNALDDAYIMVSTTEGQLAMVEGLGERWTDLVVPAILVYDGEGNLAGEFIDADARTDRILARVRELVGEPAQARADRQPLE